MQEALQASKSQPQPQLLLYSGHDTTIMPLLVMLGQDTLDWPPYCSNLVFELWEVPGSWLKRPGHLVRVLYNRSVLPISGQNGAALQIDRVTDCNSSTAEWTCLASPKTCCFAVHALQLVGS